MKRVISSVVAVMFVVLAVSCATGQHNAQGKKFKAVLINKSPATITFVLDGSKYLVPPFDFKEIEVLPCDECTIELFADYQGKYWSVGGASKGFIKNVPEPLTLPNGEVRSYGWACSYSGSFN